MNIWESLKLGLQLQDSDRHCRMSAASLLKLFGYSANDLAELTIDISQGSHLNR